MFATGLGMSDRHVMRRATPWRACSPKEKCGPGVALGGGEGTVYGLTMVALIRRVRNRMTAAFAVFATGAAIAQAAGAIEWLRISFGIAAVVGAVGALGLLWLEQQGEQEQEADQRFKDALEMLGEADVRRGGIYLLERIARDAPQKYHGHVVELLTGYVREHARWGPSDAERAASSPPLKTRLAQDVQAAITVLGRRDPGNDDETVQLRLSDVDLRGASLRGGHFEGARFRRAHLEGAQLEGVQLQGAKLRDAHLEGADLGPDPELGLPGANLEGAYLHGANFEGAKLKGARLKGAHFDAETVWPAGFDPDTEGCVYAGHDQRTSPASRR
jgi:hypothetical protein